MHIHGNCAVHFFIFAAMHTVALIREGKFPPDSRVVLTPAQCRQLQEKYKDVKIIVQPSHGRCYHDNEYAGAGITVMEEIDDCDYLLGVKEVPADLLIEGKKYLFFSHTIKKQPHNKALLQELLRKKITMIDYECLTDDNNNRVIAFGHWAGIVGTHNALWTWGERTGNFQLKRAKDCRDYTELIAQYAAIKIPPVRIILTGAGRAAQGCLEILQKLKIKQVNKNELLMQLFNEPVFVVLDADDLYERIADRQFERREFFTQPQLYKSKFIPFAYKCDLLVNAIFWNPKAPALFEKADMHDLRFAIKVIADISCDINGGIPATIQSTTINDPVFGYNIHTDKATAPFENDTIDIMAIDNLPNELPRNASEEFGNQMIKYVWEEFFKENSRMLYEATICKNGKLNAPFEYLSDYAYPL